MIPAHAMCYAGEIAVLDSGALSGNNTCFRAKADDSGMCNLLC